MIGTPAADAAFVTSAKLVRLSMMVTGNMVMRDCLHADILHLLEQVVAWLRLLISGMSQARQCLIVIESTLGGYKWFIRKC
ncbi:hypothetical protein D3C84_899100 [compost metagenome]